MSTYYVAAVVSEAPLDICREGSPIVAATVFESGREIEDSAVGKRMATGEDLERARILCAALNGPAPVHVPRAMDSAPTDGTHILAQTSDFGWIEAWWDPAPVADGEMQPGAWVSWFALDPEHPLDRRLYCGATPIAWLPCPGPVPDVHNFEKVRWP